MSELVPAVPPELPSAGVLSEDALAEAALALLLADKRSDNTRRAYAADIADFFRSRGEEPAPAAIAALCRQERGPLALDLNRYKAYLRQKGLAEATVNRRLAAVRALLRMARRLGAPCPDPAGLVDDEKVVPYRDTRGPALADAAWLLSAPDRTTEKGKRDYALLLLLCENALRRNEPLGCNIADFDAAARRLHIIGKGRGAQKEPITISEETTAALSDYLAARGNLAPDAPLFVSISRAHEPERLTGRSLARMVDYYARRALGRPLNPHALRHMAITAALDATAGDVRRVQKLSRHKKLETLMIYDDTRADLQGEVTQMLSMLFKNRRQ